MSLGVSLHGVIVTDASVIGHQSKRIELVCRIARPGPRHPERGMPVSVASDSDRSESSLPAISWPIGTGSGVLYCTDCFGLFSLGCFTTMEYKEINDWWSPEGRENECEGIWFLKQVSAGRLHKDENYNRTEPQSRESWSPSRSHRFDARPL